VDGCIYPGWTVPIDYDPLLAKLAVWAGRREETTDRMIRALREYDVGGIRTNIGFFRQILEDVKFRAGELHTGFIDEFFERNRRSPWGTPAPKDMTAAAGLAAALYTLSRNGNSGQKDNGTGRAGAWVSTGRSALLR
jgi:acetyl-CoA carboxylase biotin carboxylase subunit